MATIDMSLYSDTQDALDTVTRDATNGDIFVYPDGWSETLSATLSLATYGTPTFSAGLMFYSPAGETATISGAATYSVWDFSAVEGIVFDGLNIGNCGSAQILRFDRFCAVRNCKIYGSSGTGLSGSVTVSNCWFDDLGIAGSATFCNCLFTNGATNSFSYAVNGGTVMRSCFLLSGTSTGSRATSNINCSFLTTGTGNAISMRSINGFLIAGNLIEGFTTGIKYDNVGTEVSPGDVSQNAFTDCTTNIDAAEFDNYLIGNESLGAALFDKTGSITSFASRLAYFNPVDQGNVYTGMDGGLVKGAVQPASGGVAAVHPLISFSHPLGQQ